MFENINNRPSPHSDLPHHSVALPDCTVVAVTFVILHKCFGIATIAVGLEVVGRCSSRVRVTDNCNCNSCITVLKLSLLTVTLNSNELQLEA